MSNIVNVTYSDFSVDNSFVDQIDFELLPNTMLTLIQNEANVTLKMSDTTTENVELNGILDKNALTNLIRCLSILKKQTKEGETDTESNAEG